MLHFGVKGYSSLFFAKGTPGGEGENYDYCYFDKSGKGELNTFIENYASAYTKTKDLGYIAIPSSNHEIGHPVDVGAVKLGRCDGCGNDEVVVA